MITKKELTNRFSTIEINSNEIELMTSHTVYEKDDEKKDVLYPDYSGSTTHGYLGTVTFDKKNKKCYHSYLSIIDGKDVVTEVGDMQELFKAIEGFVAHVKDFHVNTDYAQPLMVEACRLESVAHQYLRHLGFKYYISDNEYGYGGIEKKNGTLDAKSCIVRLSCTCDDKKRDERVLSIVMHNNDGTYSHVDCHSMIEVLKNLHSLVYSKMILSNEKCFMFLNNMKESNQYILGKLVNSEIKSFDFSDFFNPKISDYKQKMIENLEMLLKQLKGE